MRRDLHHRWLETKGHLPSLGTSRRALLDAARAAKAPAAVASTRECLCRPSARLAA